MLKVIFKIGWRNLVKNKGYSFINIGGLAIGMAVALLISLRYMMNCLLISIMKIIRRLLKSIELETRGGETQANTAHVPGLGTLLKKLNTVLILKM
ncbi:MAG: hypothetical protein IPJ20_14925 [Flammeovirgaceae bacterium]|nr:hypothetical protein [Flammeovirgaceae bacterium]